MDLSMKKLNELKSSYLKFLKTFGTKNYKFYL